MRIARERPGLAAGLLFVTMVVTYGYFQNEPAWNGFSRMNLVRSLVEDGTTRIDRFHENTGDKARLDGHYYSDKAPGASFLALPVHALRFAWLRATVGEAEARNSPEAFYQSLYLSSFAVVAIPSALLVAFLYVLALELGARRPQALFSALALGLGSLAFPYSTLFFGHQLSAVLLFTAFGLLALERRRSAERHSTWRSWPAACAGLAAGYAFVTEFPAAVPAFLIFLYLVWVRPGRRAILLFVSGGLVSVLPLLGYNQASFGRPFELGYEHLVNEGFVEGSRQGLLGLTYPKGGALLEILFGSYRGLLPLCPVLALSALGVARMWRGRKDLRAELALCSSVVVFYLLFNASYFNWHGGWALGPRYAEPMLPFLCLPIAFAIERRFALPLALLALSAWHMLMAASVTPLVPETGPRSTLADFLYPHFLADKVPAPGGSRNLGQRLDLQGRRTLLPLLGLWALAAAALVATLWTERPGSADGAMGGVGSRGGGLARARGAVWALCALPAVALFCFLLVQEPAPVKAPESPAAEARESPPVSEAPSTPTTMTPLLPPSSKRRARIGSVPSAAERPRGESR